MVKKTVSYTDYNGVSKTDDFYFNYNETQARDFVMGYPNGLEPAIRKMIAEKDQAGLYFLIKDVVLHGYGVKTSDGRFHKSAQLREEFSETEAFNVIFTELLENQAELEAFLKKAFPASMIANAPEIAVSNAQG